MRSTWVPLHDIPAEGRDFSFPDSTLWSEIWEEYNLPYRVGRPLAATLHLTVHEGAVGEGVYIKGEVEGSILVDCDRCTENAEAHVDTVLEDFEALEDEDDDAPVVEAPKSKRGKKGAKDAKEAKPQEAPAALTQQESLEAPTQDVLRVGPQGLEFDVQGYLWQQFVLALPAKPLCDPDCKGLCPKCGVNLNEEQCSCQDDEGDPRLAVLRQLKRS